MNQNDLPRYITLKEAAQVLSLDEKTIRRYIASGDLHGYRIGARALRVTLDEVLTLAKPVTS
jgi:excisionase family DNA binding protein